MSSFPRAISRTFTTARTQSSRPQLVKPGALIELREYDLVPARSAEYMSLTATTMPVRLSHTPCRLFSFPDTGGRLDVATHFYYYEGGHEMRNMALAGAASDPEWASYLATASPCVAAKHSSLFAEAPLVASTEGVCGLLGSPAAVDSGGGCIYEVRRYRLKLGYDTVPKFLNLYGAGLPSKLAAEGTDPSTSLTTVLYSEVGNLNEVIELWRHGGGTAAMERSRVAARTAPEWRDAIAQIAGLAKNFTSTIHRPAPFSPWQ